MVPAGPDQSSATATRFSLGAEAYLRLWAPVLRPHAVRLLDGFPSVSGERHPPSAAPEPVAIADLPAAGPCTGRAGRTLDNVTSQRRRSLIPLLGGARIARWEPASWAWMKQVA